MPSFRDGKNGEWNGLLTTNLELDFQDAYRIYSMRWTIEVFFKECKQYLGLGKCQSQDFDAQIASTTICVLQYNLLSVVKRFEGYETIGELFRNTKENIVELTLWERIWQIIIEMIHELANIFECDTELLMEQIISENERLKNLQKIFPLLPCG